MGPIDENCCLAPCANQTIGLSTCVVEATTGQFLDCDIPDCTNFNITNITEEDTTLPLIVLDTSVNATMPSSAFQWGEFDVMDIGIACAKDWNAFAVCLFNKCPNFLEVCDGTVGEYGT
jgi:hypothetical protein